jgi:hypothetical protein
MKKDGAGITTLMADAKRKMEVVARMSTPLACHKKKEQDYSLKTARKGKAKAKERKEKEKEKIKEKEKESTKEKEKDSKARNPTEKEKATKAMMTKEKGKQWHSGTMIKEKETTTKTLTKGKVSGTMEKEKAKNPAKDGGNKANGGISELQTKETGIKEKIPTTKVKGKEKVKKKVKAKAKEPGSNKATSMEIREPG